MMGGGTPAMTRAEVMATLRGLGVPVVPKQTLSSWIRAGVVAPSVRRTRRTGVAHEWSLEDVIGLAWLSRARADGMSVIEHAKAIGQMWKRLPELLQQSGVLYFVVWGREIGVRTEDDLVSLIRSHPVYRVWFWKSPMTIAELRGGRGDTGLLKQGGTDTETDLTG